MTAKLADLIAVAACCGVAILRGSGGAACFSGTGAKASHAGIGEGGATVDGVGGISLLFVCGWLAGAMASAVQGSGLCGGHGAAVCRACT